MKDKKRYRAKIEIGRTIKGEPIYKYAHGHTRKELEAAKDELKKKYAVGVDGVNRDVTFGQFVLDWFESYKLHTLSEGSKGSYLAAINKHLLPVFGTRKLRSISAIDLQNYLNTMAGMSKTTVAYSRIVIRGVFSTAADQGIIDRDPSLNLKKPKTTTNQRRALTDAERAAVLTVGNSHPEGLILLVLYYTGLRRGEALGLQWKDVDFQNRLLHIRRDIDFLTNSIGELKTKAAYRDVPIPPQLLEKLDAVRGIGETFVFQSQKNKSFMPKSSFNKIWRSLMIEMYECDSSLENKKYNGINGSILTPHYFRHNYATLLYDAGVDVLAAQKVLGHTDIKTTLGIYSHLSERNFELTKEKIYSAFA